MTVRDDVGRVAKVCARVALTAWDPAGTIATAFKEMMLAILGTNGKIVKMSSASTHALTGTASSGPRANREDKVTADLPDVNGIVHTFKLPTPSVDIAESLGSDKLDLTDSLVLAWVSAMHSHAKTSDGVAFSGTITGGRYIRHKTEKKGGY